MPTVERILQLAPTACYLASNYKSKSGLFGGVPISAKNQAILIYWYWKILNKIYTQDPTYEGLQAPANYLYELIQKFAFKSANIVDGGGGGQVVPPTGGSNALISPLPVVSADFVDATNWQGANPYNQVVLATDTLSVFWDDAQIFLEEGTQWERTTLGINILEPGFDAQSNDYQFYIFVSRI